MIKSRVDDLFPLEYSDEMPSLMSAWGRVDIHAVIAKFLIDNNVKGDYLEFGVGKGRSAVSAVRAYSRENVCSKFYLFDSFKGLPKLVGSDESSDQFNEGDFSYSKNQVIEFINQYISFLENKIVLIEGWFEETLGKWISENPKAKAAVVHIDVDLHSSCYEVLNGIRSCLQTGTVIIFDDWNCFKASSRHGERLATRTWLSQNTDIKLNSYCTYGWHGHAFIVELNEES
jgi:hypothetical protein